MKHTFFRITSCFLILSLLVTTGCSSITIRSEPPGAKILLDGIPMSFETPRKISINYFPIGIHTVSVEKAGFRSVTPPQTLWVRVSTPAIIFSIIIPPVFFIELFGKRWQRLYRFPEMPFILEEIPEKKE